LAINRRRKERRSIEAMTRTDTTTTTKTTHHYLRALVMLVGLVVIISSLVEQSRPARAAFPEQNGKIAYSGYDGNHLQIYTIKPDGGGKRPVTDNATNDEDPYWGRQ
jgi:hypothetical protein